MLKIDAFFNCYLCPEIRGIPSAKTGNPVNSGCIWILSKTYQRREIGKLRCYENYEYCTNVQFFSLILDK